MKKLFILSLAFASLSAHAEIGNYIQEACQKPEIKKQVGDNGSCRAIVTSSQAPKASCTGYWGMMTCTVNYDPDLKYSELSLNCYTTPGESQPFELDGEGFTYTLSTVGRTSKGKDFVVNDPNEYRIYSNEMIEMIVIVEKGKKQKISGSINLSMDAGSVVSLSDVTCN